MTKQQPEEALKLPTFGQRKMASRVVCRRWQAPCAKIPVRNARRNRIHHLRLRSRRRALDEPLGVDLIVVGSANGVQAATVVEALAAKAFGGMVQGFLFAKPMTAQKFALTSLRRPVTIPE